MEAKQEYKETLQQASPPDPTRKKVWSSPVTRETNLKAPPLVHYIYPPPEVMTTLLHTYFASYNLLYPLLHRPSFMALIAQNRHLYDPDFGATVLAVCAMSAQKSNDARLLADPNNPRSAGLQWFDQIKITERSVLEPPTVYTLQTYFVRYLIVLCNAALIDLDLVICIAATR